MGVEIERKFLVKPQEWNILSKPEGVLIKQGYLLIESSKTVRVRIKGTMGYITIKGESRAISRDEFEYKIPVADAEELIQNFCGNVISKVRYKILFAGNLWEVDVFNGDNEGLVIAEIELKSEEQEFEIPGWVGKEVSTDTRFYNANLSVNPYRKWNPLQKKGIHT